MIERHPGSAERQSRDPEDTRTPQEIEAANAINYGPSPLKLAAALYDLTESERLILILSVAPFHMGSPYAKLGGSKPSVVDVDRYAREIVAKRSVDPL